MTYAQPVISLPRDAYRHLIFQLRALLPPGSDQPEALVLRDRAAIAQAAALCPGNAAQAALAAQHVAANAYAMECLRRTRDPDVTQEVWARCMAQAASMMRQSQGALRLLLKAQSEKIRQEANATHASNAAWAEHCAEQWMMDALEPDGPGDTAAQVDRDQNPIRSLMDQHFETDSDMPGRDELPPCGDMAPDSVHSMIRLDENRDRETEPGDVRSIVHTAVESGCGSKAERESLFVGCGFGEPMHETDSGRVPPDPPLSPPLPLARRAGRDRLGSDGDDSVGTIPTDLRPGAPMEAAEARSPAPAGDEPITRDWPPPHAVPPSSHDREGTRPWQTIHAGHAAPPARPGAISAPTTSWAGSIW